MLLSVLQELIACGVQRIAVVVPVAPSIQDLAIGGGGPNNGGPLPGPGCLGRPRGAQELESLDR